MLQIAVSFVGGALLSALTVIGLYNARLAEMRTKLANVSHAGRIDGLRIRHIENQLSKLVPNFEAFAAPPNGLQDD